MYIRSIFFSDKTFSITRYQFNADNAGTHFWHAHTGLQKIDGCFGRLTVRRSPRHEIHSKLYDFDLSRHGIIVSDWMHELGASRIPGRRMQPSPRYQDPDSILINGKGRYQVNLSLCDFTNLIIWTEMKSKRISDEGCVADVFFEIRG